MCGLSCSMPPIHISPFFFIISSDATSPPVTSTKLIWPTVENVRARYYRLHSLLTPPSLALPILLCPAPSASTKTTETPVSKRQIHRQSCCTVFHNVTVHLMASAVWLATPRDPLFHLPPKISHPTSGVCFANGRVVKLQVRMHNDFEFPH
jgi:hypothetical protein